MKKIILASTSPRRKEILSMTRLEFEVVASEYEEDMTENLPPSELAKKLSLGKAEDIAKKYDDAIIIAADTFVTLDGKVLGKPYTPEKAKEMLSFMSGKTHTCITGFTIIDTDSKKTISEAVVTNVYFKPLTDSEIDTYIASGEPLDRSGSYAIQGLGGVFVEKLDGDFFNVMGLPLNRLVERLKEFDIHVL
jgi:septum formation protein